MYDMIEKKMFFFLIILFFKLYFLFKYLKKEYSISSLQVII